MQSKVGQATSSGAREEGVADDSPADWDTPIAPQLGSERDREPSSGSATIAQSPGDLPPAGSGTGMVLCAVGSRRLQARCELVPDDLRHAREAFPRDVEDVRVVVRLWRVSDNGSREEAAIAPWGTKTSGLQGEVCFELHDDGGLFESELGLESADGGWILLARSSPVRQSPATVVGSPLVTEDDERKGGEGELDLAVEAALAAADQPLEPRFPDPVRDGGDEATRSAPPLDATAAVPVGGVALLVQAPASELTRAGRRTDERSLPAPAHHETEALGPLPPPMLPSSRDAALPAGAAPMTCYDPSRAGSAGERPGGPGQRSGMEVHADLLIYGSASPGTLIELFGRNLRVGADGRFSVRRPLEDPFPSAWVVGRGNKKAP